MDENVSVSRPKFVGAYVKNVQLALEAAAISGQHLTLVGESGVGKTDMAFSFAKDVFGSERLSFLELSDATSPDEVTGLPDGDLAMKGVYKVKRDGTPFDPKVRFCIADELSRTNDTVFSIMLHVLDPKQRPTPLTVVATNNFLVVNKRTEALLDRFALYAFVVPGKLNIAELSACELSASAGVQKQLPGPLPTFEVIEEVFNMLPGDNARQLISEFVDGLHDTFLAATTADDKSAAILKSMLPRFGNRRVKQITRLLFAMTAARTGVADFTAIHPDAIKALMFAFTLLSQEEARAWGDFLGVVNDPVQILIDELLEGLYESLEKANTNVANRINVATAAIAAVNKVIPEIKAAVGGNEDDPRYTAAVDAAQQAMRKMIGQAA